MKRLTKGVLIILIMVMTSLLVCPSMAADKPIRLKFSCQAPGGSYGTATFAWWADRIERLTNGRVKMDMYWSGSLVPPKEQLPALKNNIADFSWVIPIYTPSLTPLWTVTSLPGIYTSIYPAGKAMEELNRMEVMKEELAKQNAILLVGTPNSSYQLISNKPVRTLKDIKGLKVRVVGLNAKVLKSLGASPVAITAPEAFTALQRKTIDGVLLSPYASCMVYKLHEVSKYYTRFDMGGVGIMLAGNLRTWNKLPQDIRKVFEETNAEMCGMWHYGYAYRGDSYAENVLLPKANIEIIDLSAQDKADIREKATMPLWNSWVEGMEKKGLPGKKVLKEWLRLNEKWAPISPFDYVEAKGKPKKR